MLFDIYFFHVYSDIQDSLKFISRVVPAPKFRFVDVTSYFFIKWNLLYCLSLLLWLEKKSQTRLTSET